ncbi:MAG: cupredoxin family copper-binding protein [Candidatus Acidiferrales bacterium]|jgi:plastocyanin
MRNEKMNFGLSSRGFHTRIWNVLLVVFLLSLSGAIGSSFSIAAQQQPPAKEVTIDNFSFGPMELTIPAGTQVTWINKDDVPHVVMSVDRIFKSKALDTDDKFSFTFHDPGTFEYFCSVHPKMTGKIIVK